MHIGFTGFVLGQGRTGIATYVKYLLRSLSAVDSRNAYDLHLSDNDLSCVPNLRANFRTHVHANWLENPIPSVLWHNTMLPIIAKRNNYSLVHIPSIRRIPLLKGCPVIVTIHDMIPEVIPYNYGSSRHFYHRYFLRHLIHRCDGVISVSQQTKDDIVKFTGYPADRIEVVYSGIDVELFRPQDHIIARQLFSKQYHIHDPFILYVSRVEHPRKNHINLIAAFERFLTKNRTNHVLVFAGAEWIGGQVVKERIAASPFRDRIVWLGHIPLEELTTPYSACDLVVFPSLYEGFGFPLLEAMACGAPVICSNTASLAELAKGQVATFDPYDPEDISQAITTALIATKTVESRKKGRAYAESFNWDRAAKDVIAVYKKYAQ